MVITTLNADLRTYTVFFNDGTSAVLRDIKQLIDVLTEYKLAYAYDLKLDGFYILKYLISLGMKKTDERKISNGKYNYLSDADGNIFFIKWKRNNKLIEIRNLSRKIPGVTIADIDECFELLDYSYSQGNDRLTIGADCLAEFRRGVKNYKSIFPELTTEEDDFIRSCYFSGPCLCNADRKVIENGYVFDKNSAFPDAMVNNKMPIRNPIKFEGEPLHKEMLYVVRFKAFFDIKEGKLPNVIVQTMGGANEYIKDSIGDQCFTMTKPDFELFLENYDIYWIEYIGGYYFNSTTSVFDEYVHKYYNMKLENDNDKIKRKYAKLMLNNLGGKLGTKPYGQRRLYNNDLTHNIETYTAKTVYVPAAAFMTAYSRCKLIREAQNLGLDHFRYCDTDSIHTDLSNPNLKLGKNLGEYKLEKKYKKAAYLGQKAYMYDGKIVCSGLSDWARENNEFTAEKFLEGFLATDRIITTENGELVYKYVNKKFGGGTQL